MSYFRHIRSTISGVFSTQMVRSVWGDCPASRYSSRMSCGHSTRNCSMKRDISPRFSPSVEVLYISVTFSARCIRR